MKITILEILPQLSQQLHLISETGTLDAQVLLAHCLDKPRTWVLAHPEAPINKIQYHKIIQSAGRLMRGEPLPYVIGHWEFYGLDFLVTPDVLIPRPDTELLTERAIKWLQLHPHKRNAVDIGTGSGCIGISLARHIPDLHIVLTDISPEALNVARMNGEKHGLLGRLEFRQSDLLDWIPIPFTFDLICANLPYIPTRTLENLPVAESESHLALDGGLSGIKVIKRLLKQAKNQLTPGGMMLLEIGPTQCDQLIRFAQKHYSFSKVQLLQDMSGRDRCLEIEQHYMIFHLCQRQDWLKSLARGKYQPDSLALEGFIHCSQFQQIIEVANRYFKTVPDVIMLTIDPEKLTSEIRWEKADAAYFPHVYGPINLEAVDKVLELAPDDDGTYREIRARLN
jgi:release factor glutamine methyltransferase